jgi:glycosyltransferase 2 family protein
VMGVVIMWGNFLVATVRFQSILKISLNQVPAFSTLFSLNLLSSFAAHLAPVGPAADVARFGYARWKLKLPIKPLVETIVMDRVIALLGLALVGLCLLPIQWRLGVDVKLLVPQLALWLACLLGMTGGHFLGCKLLPPHWGKITTLINSFLNLFGTLLNHRYGLAQQIILAVAYSGSFSLLMWVFAQDMGIEGDLLFFMAFGPLVLLAQSIPIFYAGWGGREFTAVATMGSIGVITASQAVSISVATGVTFFIATLPGAAIQLYSKRNNDLKYPDNN